MGILGAFVLFAIFIMAYITIIEIFTVLFRLTGLTREKARTQVISMLTNSGFTTQESEVILASRKRRKLAQITMLFGYSFTVIIVSMIVNLFLALSQSEVKNMMASVLIFLAVMGGPLLLMRLTFVQQKFDHLIEKLGNRVMFGKHSNAVVLIDNYRGSAMVEVHMENLPEILDGVPLANAALKKRYDIQILHIKRAGKVLEKIDGETMLLQNDVVFLFGNYKNIRVIFEKPDKSSASHSSPEN